MNKLLTTAMRLVALSTLAGCATVYRVSESDATTPPPPLEQPAMRNPAVLVKATPDGADASRLAARLKTDAEANLASRGFDVHVKAPFDSVVALDVSRREAARLDDWRIYEGVVRVQVSDAATGRMSASESFKAQGPRALDERKAEDGLKDALARQMSDWLEKKVVAKKIPVPPGPPPAPRATAMITISPADPAEDAEDVLVVQRRFMDAIASRPGIVSCVLAQEIPASRAYVFRVEYEPQAFPGGLLNTIVLERPDLGGNTRLEIIR